MKHMQTEELIRVSAKLLFAKYGYDDVSMRILARESGVGQSSIYLFFKSKDVLLKTIYEDTNRVLEVERSKLVSQPSAKGMFEQLIIDDIVSFSMAALRK